MDAFKPRDKHGPEYFIQDRYAKFLEAKGWLVERMVGNAFQKGIPDLYLAHPEYGTRWCDIKVYGKYNFTKAQRIKWPMWEQYGIGIWILGAPSKQECTKAYMIEESNNILFQPPNWRNFWKASWDDKPDIDKMLEELGDAS